MTQTEKAVLDALIELETAVAQMAASNPKPNLLPIFNRLDELTNQLPANTPPDLLHYLHKKSYQKARLWLEEQQAGRGSKGEGRGFGEKENHVL